MQVGKKQNSRCPLCKNLTKSSLLSFSKFWFCSNCYLAWVKLIPKTSYKTEYYKSGSTALSKVFAPIILLFYRIRESYVGFKTKDLWVDVGAGDGAFLKSVSAKEKIGIETSSVGMKIMRNAGLNALTDKEYLKTKGLNASIISFWHVLEHIENPKDYLSTARINLNKNGRLIVGVPNIDSFEFKFFKKHWFHLAPQFHIWHFSPISLKLLLEKEGFKIEKIDYWSVEHHLTGLLQSFINFTSNSSGLLHHIFKRSTYNYSLKKKELFWIFFWCTFGLPFVLLFWIISSIFQKSGTFVVIAKRK